MWLRNHVHFITNIIFALENIFANYKKCKCAEFPLLINDELAQKYKFIFFVASVILV